MRLIYIFPGFSVTVYAIIIGVAKVLEVLRKVKAVRRQVRFARGEEVVNML